MVPRNFYPIECPVINKCIMILILTVKTLGIVHCGAEILFFSNNGLRTETHTDTHIYI